MPKISEHKGIQVDAVKAWLRSLDESRRTSDPGDISPKAQVAFWRFCQELGASILKMIDGVEDDDDAILYAMIQTAQLAGIRAALVHQCPGCALSALMDGPQAMISSFHHAMHAIVEREEAGESREEVIHGPIQ